MNQIKKEEKNLNKKISNKIIKRLLYFQIKYSNKFKYFFFLNKKLKPKKNLQNIKKKENLKIL